MNPLRRLPAYAVNGIAVALGIAVIQLLIASVWGLHASQLALSGAVCASLADVPNTAARTWQRVSVAGALGIASALVVEWLKPHPQVLGAGVAAITFVAMMTMAWGARAGPVSFAPVLALVFTMAVPPGAAPPLAVAGWSAAGTLAYLAWSMLAGHVLQRRYRTLSLVAALRSTAALLDSRAALLEAPDGTTTDIGAMRAWIQGEADLAERLQTARDFVFAEPDTPRSRRETAILLRAIELRDVLLASRLDLDLLARDGAGRDILRRVARALRRFGTELQWIADALETGDTPPSPRDLRAEVRAMFDGAARDAGELHRRLLPAVLNRADTIAVDVLRIGALLRGAEGDAPLTREQLQRFVAPEGWPLQALRAQATFDSPVLRHALRMSLALACAYYLGVALPWASHPHWLVLSVAVVLRGNLEQTLSRRDARVAGTLIGCVVVLLLSWLAPPHALPWIFLVAVGVAHAFVTQRYLLTAVAATVMALLQSHMVDPAGGFAIGERVADTVLGAALAWAFSYVLPSWERRTLPRAVGVALAALRDYARHALSLQPSDVVEQRLARRRAYDALGALAAMLQRSTAEPRAVQVPVRELAALIDHGQRLLAHLSLVRLMLTQRAEELRPRAEVGTLLSDAGANLGECLKLDSQPQAAASDHAPAADVDEPTQLPTRGPADDVMPWLVRRVQLLVRDARRIRGAAGDAVAGVAGGPAASGG